MKARPVPALRRVALLTACLFAACAPDFRPHAGPPLSPEEAMLENAKKVDFALAATKELIQRSRGATYLPDMYMRLAELYTERARYAWLAQYEARRAKNDLAKSFDAPEARLLKNLALGVYDRIIREFPEFARNDEAMFLMAHEYRELGEIDTSKATYEKLIATYPKSGHRLEAYLVLGDLAFDKGDLDKAELYYNQVIAEPSSRVHPLARYKLAWVRVNKEDCKGAVRLFEKILRDKSTPKGQQSLVMTQRAMNLTRESLVDAAYCYPEVYNERPAAPYFRGLATSSSDYLAAMRRAANRFFVKQMYAQAAAAYGEVLDSASADNDAIETSRRLYDTVTRGKVFTRAQQDVARLLRTLDERRYDHRMPQAKRNELLVEFEVYARDLATKTHLAAKDQKSTPLFAAAAGAYETYLGYFPTAKAAIEIELNLAEALLAANRYFDSARAFERVADRLKDDARKQALTNAIGAYQQALEKGSLGRVERVLARGGIQAMGRGLITDAPADPKMPQIKLAVARSLYDGGEYAQAAELFYALTRQFPQSSEATAAGELALDALRLAEDYEGMAALGKRMLSDPRLGDARFKQRVADVAQKAEQRQVTELTLLAAGDRQEQLLSFAKQHKGSAGGEQALYNMIVVAESSGDSEQLYALGQEFVDTYKASPKRLEVLIALTTVSTSRADFGQAAGFLEALYDADPEAKGAVERLASASSIRAFLGDAKVAMDVKKLAGRAPEKLDDLLLTIARSGNLSALEDILRSVPAESTVAEFFRGYFAVKRGDRDEAQKRLQDVTKAKVQSDTQAEILAKAKFLLGEIAFEAFSADVEGGDIAKQVSQKSALLGQLDKSYAQAIQSREAVWALAAIGRLGVAYAQYAGFLRNLSLPAELSADEQKQLRQALGAKAQDAEGRSVEFRKLCAKRATELTVFSEVVRACLTEQPLPETVPLFPAPSERRTIDQAQAQATRQKLIKTPKNLEALMSLAELHLGAGDLGATLLILDRAEDVSPKNSALANLRGVALERLGDSNAAYAAFAKAAELDPSNTRARLNLAAHYAFYGFADRAEQELAKAGAVTIRGDAGEHPQITVLTQRAAPGGDRP